MTTQSVLPARRACLLIATTVAISMFTVPSPADARPAGVIVPVKTAAQAEAKRDKVLRIARTKVGKRYILGTAGPHTFDCSGFVNYVYRRATTKTLPRTSYQLRSSVSRVAAHKRKPGDLVFFNNNGHVAIYLGKNKIVHAANSRSGVRIDRISGWYASTLGGYARVIRKK